MCVGILKTGYGTVIIIKKIRVIVIVMMVGIVYPMQHLVLQDKNQDISFTSLQGFSLTSLSKGPQWALALHQEVDDVRMRVINSNDTRLLALFNVACASVCVDDIHKITVWFYCWSWLLDQFVHSCMLCI